MFRALAAVCTVDCAIEIVLITLHYITLGGLGERCKLPQRVYGKAPAEIEFVAF